MTANQIAYQQAQTAADNAQENIRSHRANEAIEQAKHQLAREEFANNARLGWVQAIFGR